jgi:hypothetical protein
MIFTKNDDRIFKYVISGNEVKILNPDGGTALIATRNPDGGEWNELTQNTWGAHETQVKNKQLATTLVESKINEVSKAYDDAMIARVSLSDGNTFGPSKSPGSNPSYSIQNTIDLIRSNCEYAIFKGMPSITLSDIDNKDVTYTFDTTASNPAYILPVVELADYLALIFYVKRTIRTNLLNLLDADEFNFDAVEFMNGATMFEDTLKKAMLVL